MNVSILQMVSIVSYSNAYLNDQLPEISNQGEKISMYCNKVLFHIPVVGHENQYTTQAPIDWFLSLKYRGVKQVKLFYKKVTHNNRPENISAGFDGGTGIWMVEVVLEERSEFWYSKWEVDEDKRKLDSDRVWNVIYKQAPISILPSEYYNIEDQSKELALILTELVSFCKTAEFSNWQSIFSGALHVLTQGKPSVETYLKDMIVEGMYANEALALMEASDRSYVFGGKGSWSDIGTLQSVELNQKYMTLSERLYINLNKSIIAFANSGK
ncbi:hypothetical protein LNQ81_17445 [Myroides sp. M-43]|uniref:hypothetical protein n=1 Tax=Myroides oncorhynchi TaxID=2893756 RepID=UPI001E40CF4A|nr:hypothetical protein [Myroides oncorhynchi]MCC9044456.1 hypothetical protein [Myroides oncorhynchi]